MSRRIARSLKHQESLSSVKPLNYAELFETMQGLVAQSGLTHQDIEDTVLSQLRKLMTQNYLEQHPDEHVDIVIEKEEETKTLVFYNIADGQRQQLQFIKQRKDKELFLNKVIAQLDAIRAAREHEKYSQSSSLLVEGMIEREEFTGYVIAIGKFDGFKARGFLPKSECIDNPMEQRMLRARGKIRACIVTIKTADSKINTCKRLDDCAPRMILSRKRPEFLAELLKEQCYEIQDGIVEIKKIVREPGIRAKVAVLSTKKDIDPRGACVGPHGTRITPIRQELSNEHIDIVEWSEDPQVLIERALAPAKIIACVLRPPAGPDEKPTADVYTALKDHKQVIGHRGANARLTYQLTGIRINAISADPRQTPKALEASYQARIANLVEYLEVDTEFAEQLVRHGYSSTFAITAAGPEKLSMINGIDPESAEILVSRAKDAQPYEEAYFLACNISQELLALLKQHGMMYLGYELAANNLLSVDGLRALEELGEELPQSLASIYSIIN